MESGLSRRMSSLKKFRARASSLLRHDKRGPSRVTNRVHAVTSGDNEDTQDKDIEAENAPPEPQESSIDNNDEQGDEHEIRVEPLTGSATAALRPAATPLRSVLRYIQSNYTDGSSIADMSSYASIPRDEEGQLRRENNNIAMYRVDSDWETMASETGSPPVRSRDSWGYRCSTFEGVVVRDEALSSNIFRQHLVPSPNDGGDISNFDLGHDGSDVATARHQVSTQFLGPDFSKYVPPTSGTATAENLAATANRRWSDFSEDEFSNNSQHHLVQVRPGEWKVVPRSRTRVAPARPQPDPSQHMGTHQESMYNTPVQERPVYYFAGDQQEMLYRSDPANNMLWNSQLSHPAINNLYAGVAQLKTHIHAMNCALQAAEHQRATDAQTIEALRAELAQAQKLLRDRGAEIETLDNSDADLSAGQEVVGEAQTDLASQASAMPAIPPRHPAHVPTRRNPSGATSLVFSSPPPDPFASSKTKYPRF